MKSTLIGFLCFLSVLSSMAQEKHTISGYIEEAGNGEALIGATIYVNELAAGTTTNVYGYYSVTLPKGIYTITFKYIGFNRVQKEISLWESVRLDMELIAADQQLEEVVVTGKAANENVQSLEMSVTELDIKSVEKMPAFAGEVDIIKSIQLLPGVSTVGEGASGFNAPN